MRTTEEYATVIEMVNAGFNDCEIARRRGIPRTTVRDWRREGPGTMRGRVPPQGTCGRCGYSHDFGALPGEREIIEAAAYAMSIVMPGHPVGRLHKGRAAGGCIELSMYSKQWPCLFPQHGSGKKHTRRIVLAAWQQAIVAENRENFVCGLIDSDGCRFVARQRQHGTLYEWTRYSFSNLSRDIRELFCTSCDALGVEWTQSSYDTIQVARRRSVARLESFIGPKR